MKECVCWCLSIISYIVLQICFVCFNIAHDFTYVCTSYWQDMQFPDFLPTRSFLSPAPLIIHITHLCHFKVSLLLVSPPQRNKLYIRLMWQLAKLVLLIVCSLIASSKDFIMQHSSLIFSLSVLWQISHFIFSVICMPKILGCWFMGSIHVIKFDF